MKGSIIKGHGYKRIIALITAAVVVLGSMVWAGHVFSSNAESAEERTEVQDAIEKEFPELVTPRDEDGDISKQEVIYVVTDANGKIKDTSVTEWLRNGAGASKINDISELKDIENTVNDKAFIQDGISLVWDAGGADIKYRGTTTKELPVEVKISYYLDGKSVSADEIAGKSGDVTIRFDYDVKTRTSEGGYDFVTPYTMASGLILDDEHFTNVKVEEGKIVDDGSKCICLGLAFPGMNDNLALDDDELNIPESVTITAYTDNFSIDGTYTAVLSGLLSDVDLGDAGSVEGRIDELRNALDKLDEASSKLVNGSADLASGAYALLKGADGVAEGARKVRSYADQLSSGLSQISGKSEDLNKGAKDVFNNLLDTAEKQMAANGLDAGDLTIGNYKSVLKKVIASLDKDAVYEKALEEVTEEVEKNRNAIEAAVTEQVKSVVATQVTASVQEKVREQVTAVARNTVREAVIGSATGMSVEEYEAAVEAGYIDQATQDAIDQAVEAQMASAEVSAQIEAGVEAQMGTEAVKAQIDAAVAQQMGSDEVKQQIQTATQAQIETLINQGMESEEVQEQLAAAEEGARQVIALKSSLDRYNAFYLGVLSYTSSVDQAAAGASELSEGASELKLGAEEAAAGASDLYAGAKKLHSGMKAFNKDGIDELISSLDESGLEDLFNRLSALEEASKKSPLIGGIADGMRGESKMIIKSEAVKP